MRASNTQPAILRLTMTVGETSAPYNQFTLPLLARQAITLCSYQSATVVPPSELTLIAGDGTWRRFWRQVRQVIQQQRFDVIHVHDAVVGNLFLLILLLTNLRLLAITIFTVHNSYENFKLRNRLLLLPIFALYRKIVCCSKASYESFPWLYRQLAGSRLTYVQNGMDIARVDRTLRAADQVPLPSGPFTVIAVGRLITIKNPLTLLDAFIESNLPNSRLVFVGTGPLDEIIRSRAAAAGMATRVELTGLLPRDEVYRRLQQADLYVSTSYGEGLPIAVLEAMACRTPAALSAIPPHCEIAHNLRGIPLLDADDQSGFAQAIRDFAALTPAARAALGERCRKRVDERFSLAQMHRGYAAIYAEVIGDQRVVFVTERLND